MQGLSFFSVSMPAFWMGLMLLYLFGVKLNAINVIGGTKGLPIIPALAMDATGFGILIRMVRTNMLQALKKDYIRAEKAKGMSGAVIVPILYHLSIGSFRFRDPQETLVPLYY